MISIQVRDIVGNPIEGASVTSIVQPTGQSQLSGTTDSTGEITFTNAYVGTYTFEASFTDFISGNTTLTLEAGGTEAYTITLESIVTGISPEWLLIAGAAVVVSVIVIIAIVLRRRRAGS
jgi:hypothetical protein